MRASCLSRMLVTGCEWERGVGMAHRREQILVVEDDPTLAKMIQLRLELVGLKVQTLGKGAEALKVAAEHRPDLVILDLRLPDINGYHVCRELRKLYHSWDVPIVMLTGMTQPIDQVRGFAHGADAYLTKPYEPSELLQVVTTLLRETALA